MALGIDFASRSRRTNPRSPVSFKIAFAKDVSGVRTATVALKCDRCGHTGSTSFREDMLQRRWSRLTLVNDYNGRGDFQPSQSEKFIGHTYCTCAGVLVFETHQLL